jgi:hypothetical protein
VSVRGALRRAVTLAAMGGLASASAAGEPCATPAALSPAKGGDELSVSREGRACVITVEHRRGIGAVRILATTDPLVLRFSGFPELESLSLASATGNLRCELERGGAAPPAHRCRLDGSSVPGPTQALGGIEFHVPEAFAPSSGKPLELRWVDYWR